jgi:hypothetical protein
MCDIPVSDASCRRFRLLHASDVADRVALYESSHMTWFSRCELRSIRRLCFRRNHIGLQPEHGDPELYRRLPLSLTVRIFVRLNSSFVVKVLTAKANFPARIRVASSAVIAGNIPPIDDCREREFTRLRSNRRGLDAAKQVVGVSETWGLCYRHNYLPNSTKLPINCDVAYTPPEKPTTSVRSNIIAI